MAIWTKPISTDELLELMASIHSPRCPDATTPEKFSDGQPILSNLPTDDIEFAEIVVDFAAALKREVARLSMAVHNRDPVNTLNAAHWIKGSGGTAGFPCFSIPALQICEAVRNNMWTDIERHLIAILDYTDRVQTPELVLTE